MKMKGAMIIKQNGKMLLKRKGKVMPLKEDVTVFDGTRITVDGMVMMTDGIARTMMEGEAITMDGRITDMETNNEAS